MKFKVVLELSDWNPNAVRSDSEMLKTLFLQYADEICMNVDKIEVTCLEPYPFKTQGEQGETTTK